MRVAKLNMLCLIKKKKDKEKTRGSKRGSVLWRPRSFFAIVSLCFEDTGSLFSNTKALFCETDIVYCFGQEHKDRVLKYMFPQTLFFYFLDGIKKPVLYWLFGLIQNIYMFLIS